MTASLPFYVKDIVKLYVRVIVRINVRHTKNIRKCMAEKNKSNTETMEKIKGLREMGVMKLEFPYCIMRIRT